MCAGGGCGVRGRVRGPGEARATGCVGQGRQRRVRPAIITVGGRACATGRRAARDGTTARKERERGTVGEKEMMETTNGIGCWKSCVRDREKIPGIRVQGFRRILSSTMKRILKKYIFSVCFILVDFF